MADDTSRLCHFQTSACASAMSALPDQRTSRGTRARSEKRQTRKLSHGAESIPAAQRTLANSS
jgi:hypothetical protein